MNSITGLIALLVAYTLTSPNMPINEELVQRAYANLMSQTQEQTEQAQELTEQAQELTQTETEIGVKKAANKTEEQTDVTVIDLESLEIDDTFDWSAHQSAEVENKSNVTTIDLEFLEMVQPSESVYQVVEPELEFPLEEVIPGAPSYPEQTYPEQSVLNQAYPEYQENGVQENSMQENGIYIPNQMSEPYPEAFVGTLKSDRLGINLNVYWSNEQSIVDADGSGVISPLASVPGDRYGHVLVGDHNYQTGKQFANAKEGDILELVTNEGTYKYSFAGTEYATSTGYDIITDSGESLATKVGGNGCLYYFTCYPLNAAYTDRRLIVKFELC